MVLVLPQKLNARTAIHKRIAARYNEALVNGDVTLVCGDIEQKADLFMLNMVTPFFQKALTPPFAGAESRRVHFDDFSPWTIRRFIRFVYHGEYDIEKADFTSVCCDKDLRSKATDGAVEKKSSEERSYQEHEPEDQGAEQNHLPGCYGPDHDWGYRALELYQFADMLDITELKDTIICNYAGDKFPPVWNLEEFLDRVRHLYAVTAERDALIRGVFVSKLIPRLDELCKDPTFVAFTKDPSMVDFVSDLAFAIADYAKCLRVELAEQGFGQRKRARGVF